MEKQLPWSRTIFWILLVFAASAVASIALQNILIWPAVLLFLGAHFKSKLKIEWPTGLFPWATVVFLLTFFLGALVGIDPANSFHTVHKYLTFLLIFPLGAMAFEHKEIQKLLLFFTYGAAFCALFGIGKHFCLHQERIDSFSGDKMVFGGMLMAGLLIQFFFLKNEPKNLLHWLSLVLLGWALVLTETRGAWVGLLVGFAFLSWRFNRKWLAIGLAFLVASYFLMPSVLQNRIKSMANIQLSYDENHQIQNSSQVRLLIWLSGIKIIKDYPWGVGQGNLSDIYPRYRLAALDKFEPTVPHLHNNFLQILVQNGWIGLAAYLFWIFSYFQGALGFKGKGDGPQDLNWTLICVFAAVLAWGLTEYTFSHQFMNVQFFLLGLQAALWKQGGAPTV